MSENETARCLERAQARFRAAVASGDRSGAANALQAVYAAEWLRAKKQHPPRPRGDDDDDE